MPAYGAADAPRVSGSLAAHYAPRTPLALLQPDVVIFAVRESLAASERLGVVAPMACPLSDERIVWRQIAGDPAGFAHDLYALLRELDGLGCARIVVQKPPQTDGWQAINDRLRRAVAGSGAVGPG
jgi:L-threonylcarbamoyladenylate synthase